MSRHRTLGQRVRARSILVLLSAMVAAPALSGSAGHAQTRMAAAADSLWRRGEFQAAGRLYAERLHADPSDAVAQHRLGILATRERRWADAFAILGPLSEQHPADAEVRVSLARVHLGMGDIGGAIAIVDSILTLRPDDVGALQARGQFAERSGRLIEAESFWRRAFALDPRDADTRLGLARTLRRQGRHAAALEILRPALAGSPWADILAEEARIAQATRPRTRFTLVREDDTDGNAIGTLIAAAGARIASHVDVRTDAWIRAARLDAGAAAEHSARGASVTIRTQREPGWAFEMSAGAATSSVSGAVTTPTWAAAVSSPERNALAATVSITNVAFDYTVPLMRQRVTLGEWSVEGRWRAGRAWTVTGAAGAGAFEGGVSGRTNRRWRANAALMREIPGGPFAIGVAWRSFGFRDDADDGYFDPDFYGLAELSGRAYHETPRWTLEAEVAPGLQRITSVGETSGSLRATGAAAYLFRPGRQLRVSATWANSGIEQLSAGPGTAYRYTAIGLGLAWWF